MLTINELCTKILQAREANYRLSLDDKVVTVYVNEQGWRDLHNDTKYHETVDTRDIASGMVHILGAQVFLVESSNHPLCVVSSH